MSVSCVLLRLRAGAFAVALLVAPPVLAGDPVTEAFSGHDPESKGRIDHSVWSGFLDRVILEAGRSTRRLGYDREPMRRMQLGSRIRYGNSNPSRFENNRVAFHLMTEEAVRLVRAYRQGLEAVTERLELAWLDRAEQLAYWLNLYNAAVVEQIAGRYPVRRLDRLRGDL